MIDLRKQEILQAVSDVCDRSSERSAVHSAIDEIEQAISAKQQQQSLAAGEKKAAGVAFRTLLTAELETCAPLLDKYCTEHGWYDNYNSYRIKIPQKYAGVSQYIFIQPLCHYGYSDTQHHETTTFIGLQYSHGNDALRNTKGKPMVEVLKHLILKAFV